MRRFGVFLSGIVVLLLGLVATGDMGTAAQEATPAVEGFMPEGITFEPVAFATGITPPPTVDLSVARVSFEPGAGFDIDAGDPSYVLAVIESGELTVRLEGVLTVTRAGALEAAMSEEEGGAATPATEEIAAGQEVTLGAGDTVLFPPNVSGAIGNDGQERTVVLVVFVGAPEDMTGEAAPTP